MLLQKAWTLCYPLLKMIECHVSFVGTRSSNFWNEESKVFSFVSLVVNVRGGGIVITIGWNVRAYYCVIRVCVIDVWQLPRCNVLNESEFCGSIFFQKVSGSKVVRKRPALCPDLAIART